MQRAVFCLILLTMLLVMGCATSRFSVRREIDFIELADFIETGQLYDKALADPVSGSVFALVKAEQQIHIFRHGKKVNTIGGLGSQSYNFQRLSDIALDNDGSLLALDMSARQLRRFSADGLLLGRMDLAGLVQPELVAMSPDRELFVYDAAPQEIICISMFDASELHRFGRFQLSAPHSLACNGRLLSVYSAKEDETQVYYVLGQFKEKLPGQQLIDVFDNYVSTQASMDSKAMLPPRSNSGPGTIYRDAITVVYPDGIGIYRIHYMRGD